jgi:hypothetical protein
MHFLQAINSDISVLIVCNKTGGTIKGDIKKSIMDSFQFFLASCDTLSEKPKNKAKLMS